MGNMQLTGTKMCNICHLNAFWVGKCKPVLQYSWYCDGQQELPFSSCMHSMSVTWSSSSYATNKPKVPEAILSHGSGGRGASRWKIANYKFYGQNARLLCCCLPHILFSLPSLAPCLSFSLVLLTVDCNFQDNGKNKKKKTMYTSSDFSAENLQAIVCQ